MKNNNQNLVNTIAEVELPTLWRFALQVTRDEDDAEDLVQRTCVRAIEHSDNYRDTGKLKSWLFRIAHNIWKNELRSRAIRERGNLLCINENRWGATDHASDNSTPESRLEFHDVVNAVEALPEGQRLVIQLVCVSGFSYAETATILDIAEGTVMSRLARARVTIGEQFLPPEPHRLKQKLPRTNHVLSTSGDQGM